MYSNHLKLKKLLHRFHLQVQKLTPYAGSMGNIRIDVSINETAQKSDISGFEEKDLYPVLICFRNFYMKESELSFMGICSEVMKDGSCQEYHQLTSEFLNCWNHLLDKTRESVGGFALVMNTSPVSARKNFDIWLNEGFFHADKYEPGSGKGLDAIKAHPVFEGMSKFIMLDLLQRLCHLIKAFDVQVVEKIGFFE